MEHADGTRSGVLERMNRPTISVVMTVYNGERYVSESLSSMFDQTYEDIELVVVDDGSTDDTARILDAISDRRLHRVRNGENRGLTRSLNRALELAQGTWIARLDAGDVALPQRLEQQLAFVQAHPEFVLVGSSAFQMDAEGRELPTIHVASAEALIRERLPKGNVFIHSSILFRNHQDIRYRDKFVYAQDYDLYLRLLSSGARLTNMSAPLVRYRVTPDSISATKLAEQYAFAEQARLFFRQRQAASHDKYADFKSEECLSGVLASSSPGLIRERIHAALRAAEFGKAREEMRDLFRRHGIVNRLPLRYVHSYAQQLRWAWRQRRLGTTGQRPGSG